MNTNKITTKSEDLKISVKMKLSALWAAVMFCFIYGDIIAFHQPGVIADIMAGKMGPFPVTQESLLIAALFMAIPSVMVFLSLVLNPKVNRRTNIVLGVFYIITNSLSAFSSSWVFFIIYGVIEGALLALIVWYAWRWPEQENHLCLTEK